MDDYKMPKIMNLVGFTQSPVLRFPGKLALSLQLVTPIFSKNWQEKIRTFLQTVFEIFDKIAFMRNLNMPQNSFVRLLF